MESKTTIIPSGFILSWSLKTLSQSLDSGITGTIKSKRCRWELLCLSPVSLTLSVASMEDWIALSGYASYSKKSLGNLLATFCLISFSSNTSLILSYQVWQPWSSKLTTRRRPCDGLISPKEAMNPGSIGWDNVPGAFMHQILNECKHGSIPETATNYNPSEVLQFWNIHHPLR